MHQAGRSPADWDQDTWDGLEELFRRAWTLNPLEQVRLAAYMDAAGLVIGATVQSGPLLALELRELVEEVSRQVRDLVLRDVIAKAARATEGDASGLRDFAQALREGAAGLEGAMRGNLPDATPEGAFACLKARMLGVQTLTPEDAFRA